MERSRMMSSACASSSSSLQPCYGFNPLLSATSSSPRRWAPCSSIRRVYLVVKSLSNADASSSSSDKAPEPPTTATAATAASTTTTTSSTNESGSDGGRNLLLSSAVDSPPFSLINYDNIRKAFIGEALLTPNHYATLELTPDATYAEVESAFKQRCEMVLQQGLNEEEIRAKLRILKVSYDILSSAEQRRLYDWSLYHSQSPGGVYRWPHEADITQTTYGPAPAEEAFEDEGIRQFGYVFLGWFLLSIVLSIVLR